MLDRLYKMGGIATPIVMLVSVVFVVLSMKQNTAAIQTATPQELVGIQIQLDDWLIDEDKVQWWLEVNTNFTSDYSQSELGPSSARKIQAARWVRNKMNLFEHIYFSNLDGALRDSVFEAWSISYADFICDWPVATHIYEENRKYYAVDFDQFVASRFDCIE